jgi:hypothetical protein
MVFAKELRAGSPRPAGPGHGQHERPGLRPGRHIPRRGCTSMGRPRILHEHGAPRGHLAQSGVPGRAARRPRMGPASPRCRYHAQPRRSRGRKPTPCPAYVPPPPIEEKSPSEETRRRSGTARATPEAWNPNTMTPPAGPPPSKVRYQSGRADVFAGDDRLPRPRLPRHPRALDHGGVRADENPNGLRVQRVRAGLRGV